MESVKYCAYNTTKASFLNLRITVVDTLKEPFDGQIESLACNGQAGLWLNPCREFPVREGLPAFDLIYLDEACRVVQVVELSPGTVREGPLATAASALALPAHTISASQTKCGDELMIWASYGEEKRPGRASKPAAALRLGPVKESQVASVSATPGGPAPSWTGEDAGIALAATARTDEKEKPAPVAEVKPTLTSRFKTWKSERLARQDADLRLSITAAPDSGASSIQASANHAAGSQAFGTHASGTQASGELDRVIASAIGPDPVPQAAMAGAPVMAAPVTSAPVMPAQVLATPVAPSPVKVVPVIDVPARAAAAMAATAAETSIAAKVIPAPVAKSAESQREQSPAAAARSAAAARVGDEPARRPIAPERSDETDRPAFRPEERHSFTARLKAWTAERMAHEDAGTPIPVTSAPDMPPLMTAAPVEPARLLQAPVAGVPAEPARLIQAPVAAAPVHAAPAAAVPVEPARFSQAPIAARLAASIAPAAPSAPVSKPAVPAAPAVAAQRAESIVAKESPTPRTPVPASTGAPVRRWQAVIEQLDQKEKAALQSEALKSQPFRYEERPPAAPPLRARTAERSAQERAATPSAVSSPAMPPAPVVRRAATPITASPAAMPAAPAARSVATPIAKPSIAPRDAAPAAAVEAPVKSQAPMERADEKKKAEPKYQRKHSLLTRIKRWVNGTAEPAERHQLPGLVAYFWTGGSPQAHPVGNISSTGLYLLTKERWMSDTVLLMNLQSASAEKGKAADSISVLSKVVRTGDDGVGMTFVTPDSLDRQSGQLLPPIQTDKETLERFLRKFQQSEAAGVR